LDAGLVHHAKLIDKYKHWKKIAEDLANVNHKNRLNLVSYEAACVSDMIGKRNLSDKVVWLNQQLATSDGATRETKEKNRCALT